MKKLSITLTALLLVINCMLVIGENKNNSDKETKSSNEVTSTIIKGKVIDKSTGEALPGAAVKLKGTSKVTYTDFEGNFKIKGIKPGNYSVVTSLISYKETAENVTINNNEKDNVNLTLESIKD